MIVVIDDDKDDFDIIAEAIKVVNPYAQLKYFDDPVKSLEILPQVSPRPSVILLDINMPKMTGVDMLIAIKKSTSLSKIPVVMLSTSPVQEQKKVCASLGATHFISKPRSWNEMLEVATYILQIQQTFA